MHCHTLENLTLNELPGNVSFLINVNIVIFKELGLRFEDYHDSLAPPDHLPQSIHSFVFNNPPSGSLSIRYIELLRSNQRAECLT